MLDSLRLKSRAKAYRTQIDFIRYLHKEIRWNNRLIGIKGARGVGKTTLLLQHLRLKLHSESALYISMDDLFFDNYRLYDLAAKFQLNGGLHLLLDEVHKYPNWSRELKLIYDDFPDLHVIFTSSSILEIHKGESDLSRRAITYTLYELSLREYIHLSGGPLISSYSLDEILTRHDKIAIEINQIIKPIPYFKSFNKNGAYPYFQEDLETFHERLQQNVALIIDVDIPAVTNIDYNMVVVLKKLLATIATSAPFTPNIAKLASLMNIARPSLLKAIDHLEKARLIQTLHRPNKGIGVLTKPDKIYLNNSNLLYILGQKNTQTGTVRETFFTNQLSGLHKLNLSKEADFLVDDIYTFEIGGKSKSQKQIKNILNSYIVKDDIEIGVDNIIPLWLFGLLY